MPDPVDPPGLYVDETVGAPLIALGDTAVTAFVGAAIHRRAASRAVRSFAEFRRRFGDDGRALADAARLFFANGGRRALIVPPRTGGVEAAIAALDSHAFQVLCVPAEADEPDLAREIHATATSVCAATRAMYPADAPFSWIASDDPVRKALEQAGRMFPKSPDAALFFPWLRLDGGVIAGPAAAVAGIIARTDAARGVWKSPAGLEATIRDVAGVTTATTDAQASDLTLASVNAVRAFPGGKPVVWGGRTLDGPASDPGDRRYIATRRLRLAIERALHSGLGWTVFEPHGEALQARVRLSVGAFLQNLFRQGAFAGQSARESWFVKCDASTTTEADIAAVNDPRDR